MYNTTSILVKSGSLYDYGNNITVASNILRNRVLFLVRQVMTAVKKDPKDWFPNEKQVMYDFEEALPVMNAKSKKSFVMPTNKKWLMSYEFLEKFLSVTDDEAYCSDKLPCHTAEAVIKDVLRDMKSFVAASKDYAKHPWKYKGKPKLPQYRDADTRYNAPISNQECVIYCENGKYYAKLPYTKERCYIGTPTGRLKEAEIVPHHNVFSINFTFEDEEPSQICKKPERCIAIDLGVNNFAAITNNIDAPCLLFKGGLLKSRNQWYNKQVSKMMSEQTKGTTNKFVPTDAFYRLSLNRDNYFRDVFHKYAKWIIQYCNEYHIDTVIVGKNKGWKQRVSLGEENNQMFVQIPFFKFQQILKYLCEQHGINYIEHEESYTSQASYLDMEFIPIYQKGVYYDYRFCGKRIVRGLYRSQRGIVINADLNGSANIGRKTFPELFQNVKFDRVVVIANPFAHKQSLKDKPKTVSRSKQKRLNRKASNSKLNVVPLG